MHKSLQTIKGDTIPVLNFSFFSFIPSFVAAAESDKRGLKKIVARAGGNLTLPCPDAVGEKSVLKIEKLTWKSSQTIIKFVHGRPLEQNQRVSPIYPLSGIWKH